MLSEPEGGFCFTIVRERPSKSQGCRLKPLHGRFDYFTDDARRTLTLSQDEAQRFNHNYIGTETMVVVAGLLDPRWRVEIEAEAQIS